MICQRRHAAVVWNLCNFWMLTWYAIIYCITEVRGILFNLSNLIFYVRIWYRDINAAKSPVACSFYAACVVSMIRRYWLINQIICFSYWKKCIRHVQKRWAQRVCGQASQRVFPAAALDSRRIYTHLMPAGPDASYCAWPDAFSDFQQQF